MENGEKRHENIMDSVLTLQDSSSFCAVVENARLYSTLSRLQSEEEKQIYFLSLLGL